MINTKNIQNTIFFQLYGIVFIIFLNITMLWHHLIFFVNSIRDIKIIFYQHKNAFECIFFIYVYIYIYQTI